MNRANSRANYLNIINERADYVFSILRVSAKRMRFKAMGKDKSAEGQEKLLSMSESNPLATSTWRVLETH